MVQLSSADTRQISQGLQISPVIALHKDSLTVKLFRDSPFSARAGEGTVCTHFHQGLFDDSADVPPPLRDVRVVVVQVWRKGQAKRSKFLWGHKSRVITVSQVVLSRSLYTLHCMQSPNGGSISSTLTGKTLLEVKPNIPSLLSLSLLLFFQTKALGLVPAQLPSLCPLCPSSRLCTSDIK